MHWGQRKVVDLAHLFSPPMSRMHWILAEIMLRIMHAQTWVLCIVTPLQISQAKNVDIVWNTPNASTIILRESTFDHIHKIHSLQTSFTWSTGMHEHTTCRKHTPDFKSFAG